MTYFHIFSILKLFTFTEFNFEVVSTYDYVFRNVKIIETLQLMIMCFCN